MVITFGVAGVTLIIKGLAEKYYFCVIIGVMLFLTFIFTILQVVVYFNSWMVLILAIMIFVFVFLLSIIIDQLTF